MQEFQLFELAHLSLDRSWSHMQWWAGVSFGLIAVANFAGKKLNWFYAAFLSAVYLAFSRYSYLNATLEVELLASFLSELRLMQDAGELSAGGSVALDAYATRSLQASIPFIAAASGLFLGSLAFLWATYFKSRKSRA